jgi:hypothetical protein
MSNMNMIRRCQMRFRRDVCLDLDKAQTKLKRIQRRLKDVQEQAAASVQLLTAAETKLTAAIVAALLSTPGQR